VKYRSPGATARSADVVDEEFSAMRSVLAASALALVLLAGAGCTDSNRSGNGSGSTDPTASTGGGAPGGTGSPGLPGASATGSDRQVCADTEKLIADSTRKFGEELVKAAQSGGDQAALSAVKTLFAEWASGLRQQAGKASNPTLKTALGEYAAGLEKVNGQLNTFADLEKLDQLNTPEIEAATEKIAQICG
jgi:hypothetical protein